MENKICPHCKEEIKKDAEICKHCWKKQITKVDVSYWIIAIVLFILFFYFIFSIWGGEEIKEKEDFSKNAKELCISSQIWVETNVKRTLKDPTSLEMPYCTNSNLTQSVDNQTRYHQKEDYYSFSSYYLAKNSFWAKIRKNYMCIIKYGNFPNYSINCSFLD